MTFQTARDMILSPFVMVRDAILNSPTQMLITALIVIVLTGMVGGMIAKKLKQPLILGYIFAGVFVGIAYKAGFGATANQSLTSLADIGVALLLFSMGLEFSKKDIRPVYKVAVWGSLAQVLFTFGAGAVIAWILGKYRPGLFQGVTSFLLFGTAFVSTSTAVVLKTLASKQRMGTLSSKVMIGVSIVQDLTVIPLMLLVCKLGDLSHGLTEALMPLVLGAVFMTVMMTAGAKYIPMWLRHVAKFESKELFLFAVTGLALGIGMISEAMQVSFSFGAFLAGIVLSDSDYGKRALYEMMPVRDLFAMLFFVSIGMMLDVTYLVQNVFPVILLMFATSFSRTIFLSLTSWIAGYRNIIPIAMFFGMFATSEIIFIVIQTGFSNGIFNENLYSLMLCVAVCSMIAGPMLDSLTAPVYSLFRRTIWKNALKSDIITPPPDLHDHVIIAGGGSIARAIARLLTGLNQKCFIIETDHLEFRTAKKEGLLCIYGDPQQEVILTAAGIANARILLLAAEDVTNSLSIIHHARHLNPAVTIVARADTREEVNILHEAQIFEIVQPKFEAGLELTRQALLSMRVSAIEIQNFLDSVRFDHYQTLIENKDIPYATLEKMRSFTGLVELNWVRLETACPLCGKSLGDSQLRSRFGISVVGIMRTGKFISNPGSGFVIMQDDILAVIGTPDEQKRFQEFTAAAPAV